MAQKQLDDRYNDWFIKSFENCMNRVWDDEIVPVVQEFVDKVVDAFAKEVSERFAFERKRVSDETKELTAEIGGLRADFEVDRILRKQGVVVDLPQFLARKNRNVA